MFWFKLYLISIIFFIQYLNVDACGIAVHNEITYRSLENFEPNNNIEEIYKRNVLNSPGFTQAGSFFPDWGYQCLGNNQQSEDAHWPTFIKVAINYVRQVYPSFKYHQDKHVNNLISFIFAVMSHGMADVKWHSLDGLEDYFIVAMAKSDFKSNVEESHLAADSGAEFTLRHSNPLTYLNQTWQVPVRDIIEIYKRLYRLPGYEKRRVPLSSHLQYCMTAGFAASKVDYKFGQLMFGYYGSKSPFLVEELYDYYKGGIEDMSGSVTDCYSELIEGFEKGVQYESPDTLCASYFYTTKPSCFNPIKENNNITKLNFNNLYQYYDIGTGVLTITSNYTYHNEKVSKEKDQLPYLVKQKRPDPYHRPQFQQPLQSTAKENNVECVALNDKVGITLTLAKSTSARVGHQIVTGNFSSNQQLDLAFSAPYYDGARGSVFVLSHVQDVIKKFHDEQDILKMSPKILNGEIRHGRFGWAMTVVDINQDGLDDLVVATPFETAERVDIYFGNSLTGLSETPSIRIQYPALSGTFLTAIDMNQDGFKDLIISCPLCSAENKPQVGKVFILKSDKKYQDTKGLIYVKPTLIIENPELEEYRHFGESVLSIKNTLLIGSPNYSINNKQRVGRVYAFDIITNKLKWTMTGSNEFQQFGKVLATNEENILAIASPSEQTKIGLETFWQGGTVRIYDWSKIQDVSSFSIEDFNQEYGMLSIIKGRSNSGHLGRSLSMNKNNHVIWIGEPMSEQENGRVYKWKLDGDYKDIKCIKNDQVDLARFGSQIDSLGFDNICITSQRYGQNARFIGAITLLETK